MKSMIYIPSYPGAIFLTTSPLIYSLMIPSQVYVVLFMHWEWFMEWSLNIPVIILKTSTQVTMNSIGSKHLKLK